MTSEDVYTEQDEIGPDDDEGLDSQDLDDEPDADEDSDPEGGDEEDESDEADSEDDDGPEADEGDDEEGEADEASDPTPEPNELESLRQKVTQYESWFHQLQQQQQFHEQQQARERAPERRFSQEAVEIAQLLLSQGDRAKAALEGRPHTEVQQGAELAALAARKAAEREVLLATDPEGWAQQVLGPTVQRMLEAQLQPIRQQQLAQYWDQKAKSYPDVIRGEADAAEVARIAMKLDPNNPARVFDDAVELYAARQQRKVLTKREERVQGKERQQRAVKRARRGAGRKSSRKGGMRVDLRSSEDDLLEIYRQIEATGDYEDLGLVEDRGRRR